MDNYDCLIIVLLTGILFVFLGIALVMFTQGPELEEVAVMLNCEQLQDRIVEKTTKWHEDRIYDVYKVKCLG